MPRERRAALYLRVSSLAFWPRIEVLRLPVRRVIEKVLLERRGQGPVEWLVDRCDPVVIGPGARAARRQRARRWREVLLLHVHNQCEVVAGNHPDIVR